MGWSLLGDFGSWIAKQQEAFLSIERGRSQQSHGVNNEQPRQRF